MFGASFLGMLPLRLMLYDTVIGLEVHARLLTNTKLFCSDANDFGDEPNTNVSPVSLAHPGTLPVLNAKAIELAVTLGIALNCTINRRNFFARKNYFYPDLPKGYQTSQHSEPICIGGEVSIRADIDSAEQPRRIKLDHIHLEEDAGKSIHDLFTDATAVDLNRAGTPLLEIVSKPDLHTAEEAMAYLSELRRLLRWLGICDGNMEEGSMRCDANISLKPRGSSVLGTRVEVKNLNSIRHLGKAIRVEEARLAGILSAGGSVVQQTRNYDAATDTTSALRTKEEAADYRYFPDPDIPPIFISQEFIDNVRASMPELPADFETRLIASLHLSAGDAALIASDQQDAAYFSELLDAGISPGLAAKKFIHQLRPLAGGGPDMHRAYPLSASAFAAYIRFTATNNVDDRLLKKLIEFPNADPNIIAEQFDLHRAGGDDELALWISDAIAALPEKVQEFQSGKKGLITLFAGKVKQISKGKADMKSVMPMLERKLNELK